MSKPQGKTCYDTRDIFCAKYVDVHEGRQSDSSIPKKTFVLWDYNKGDE